MGFKQTNPDDNPVDDDGKTDRDRELEAARQNRAEDRPAGVTGVDKAHGGGSAGLEAATDAMRGVGGGRGGRPNNNNPGDPTNPQNNLGGAGGGLSAAQQSREDWSEPRTTADEELPSKRETRETAEREAGERREAEQQKQRDDREKNLAANQEAGASAGLGAAGPIGSGIGSNKRPADPDGTSGNKNRPDV